LKLIDSLEFIFRLSISSIFLNALQNSGG